MCKAALVALAICCAGVGPAMAQQKSAGVPDDLKEPRWTRYVEPDSGTALDLPMGVFTRDTGPLEKGKGKRLRTADERAELSIYSLDNDRRETPRSYVRHRLQVDPRSLDYVRITRRFFVVSGINENRVFYSRCNFARRQRGAMHCILMAYPQSETKAWDRIVTRISLSLRGAAPSERPPVPPETDKKAQ